MLFCTYRIKVFYQIFDLQMFYPSIWVILSFSRPCFSKRSFHFWWSQHLLYLPTVIRFTETFKNFTKALNFLFQKIQKSEVNTKETSFLSSLLISPASSHPTTLTLTPNSPHQPHSKKLYSFQNGHALTALPASRHFSICLDTSPVKALISLSSICVKWERERERFIDSDS